MFGLGFWEIAVILGAALLLFGPKKLPELARGLGRGLREFRKATEDFKSTMDAELHAPEAPKQKAPEVKEAEEPEAPKPLPDTVSRKPNYGVAAMEKAETEPVETAEAAEPAETSTKPA